MTIALYGSMLLIVLLGTTALSLRSRGPAPTEPASVAQASAATRRASATVDASATPSEAPSATPTVTVTGTAGPSPTATRTPTQTPTDTPSPTNTPTHTATPSPTFTPSLTPTSTYTPTPYPTPGPGAANRKVCVPILTYHHIGYAPADANDIELGLTTSPEQFAEHLRLFQEAGVVTISLDDLQYALALGWPLPEKPVIITIDDGYDDIYQYAFPLLEQSSYAATLFIATGFIDRGVPGYMTWPQIEEMAAAGNDVQPHTIDHLDLRGRNRDSLIYQILGSKETVEAHTGRVARYFAYPAGAYDDNAIALLGEMNFWAAVSTDSGVVHSLDTIYTLKRLRVSNSIDLESMKVYLRFCGFDVP